MGQSPLWVHIGIAVPRIMATLILAVKYGSNKFGTPFTPEEKGLSLFQISDGFVEFIGGVNDLFALAPLLFAWLAGFSETIGAFFVAIGFRTRFFSLMLIITMLFAIGQHWGEEMKMLLPSLCFFWIGLYSLILGSGRIGIDGLLNRRIKA